MFGARTLDFFFYFILLLLLHISLFSHCGATQMHSLLLLLLLLFFIFFLLSHEIKKVGFLCIHLYCLNGVFLFVYFSFYFIFLVIIVRFIFNVIDCDQFNLNGLTVFVNRHVLRAPCTVLNRFAERVVSVCRLSPY